jgi:hypothetical protein
MTLSLLRFVPIEVTRHLKSGKLLNKAKKLTITITEKQRRVMIDELANCRILAKDVVPTRIYELISQKQRTYTIVLLSIESFSYLKRES